MGSASVEIRVFLCLLVLAAVGCSSSDEPEHVISYSHNYSEELAIPVNEDTVLLLVGTDGNLPSNIDTTGVFVDTAFSEANIMRLNVQVVGSTYTREDRAIVEHRWRGDTLQVWVGYRPPWSWETSTGFEKTSYPPPWFMAKRIDVRLPEGTAVRYLGRWFE